MTYRLESLPPELLLHIDSYLAPSSRISLKLTSRLLYLSTPTPPPAELKQLALCERAAVRRYIYERADLAAGKRVCLVCKSLQPRRFFHDALGADAGAGANAAQVAPVCAWHDGWRMRAAPPARRMERSLVAALTALARSLPAARWMPLRRSLCVGCLAIWGWDVVGRCHCRCRTCGVFPIICYVRLSPVSDPPRAWDWPRAGEDGAYVLEEHRLGDDPRRRVWVRVPVLEWDASLDGPEKVYSAHAQGK